MQTNVALCGVVEWVEWEVRDAWSFFGRDLYHLSAGFRWDLEPEEWDVDWEDWDPFAESTIEQAANQYAVDPAWAERHLGTPRQRRGSISIEQIDVFWEIRALQEEYGDEFETIMLREEPSILDAMMGNWWLRIP